MTTRIRQATSTPLAPIAIVAIGAVSLWLATGVRVDQILRYVGYELAFVIVPGWLVFRAISPGTRSLLWQVTVGWSLGLVIEIMFFSLTAAIGMRDLFYLLPLLVAAPALIVWRARTRAAATTEEPEPAEPAAEAARPFSTAQLWAIAGLCLVAFAYLGLTLIAQSPIPGSVPYVFYEQDNLFHISVAAEALHHWPLTSPQVSGISFAYHYFVHLHIAAIAQVTGIDLPIIYLRLFLIGLVTLVLLQLSLAGRVIGRFAWAGPLAAGLFLLVWEVDLSIPELAPLFGINQISLWTSPSYAFGIALFVPLVVLVAGMLEPGVLARGGFALSRKEAACLAGVLALGVGGAKSLLLPMMAGGLAIYLAWRWLQSRSIDRLALAMFGVSVGLLLAYVAVLYGTEAGTMSLGVGDMYGFIPALRELRGLVGDSLGDRVAYWGAGSVLTTVFLFGPPLFGLIWILGRGRPELGPARMLFLSILAVGMLGWLFLKHVAAVEFYFGFYGVIVGIPVAAEGLCRGLAPWAEARDGSRRRVLLGAGVWLAVCLVLAYVARHLVFDGAHYAQAYFLIYGCVGAALAAAAWFALRAGPARRPGRVALAILMVLIVASLDLVLDTVPETVRKLDDGETLYLSKAPWMGLRRGVYEGAVWVRDNTDEDAVISISNQTTPRAKLFASNNTAFPAFSERRAFYEGWHYDQNALRQPGIEFQAIVDGKDFPYPHRHELEQRVFKHADPDALREMEDDFGVTHIVVDRLDGRVNPRLYRMGKVVFSNGAVDVLELNPSS